MITIDNMSKAFGDDADKGRIVKTARKVFENLALVMFETAWAYQKKEKDLTPYFTQTGFKHMKDARNKNKGVLVLTGHVGNWELMSYAGLLMELDPQIVYRPLDFKPLDNVVNTVRCRFGAGLIPARLAMRKILQQLKRKKVVSLLMDQSVDWYDGVFVNFFGRRACTNKGLALLALKTEAPVVPVFLLRDGKKPFHFHAIVLPEIPLVKTGDKTKDIDVNTQNYNMVLEKIIRAYPDQWFWVHRRWKTLSYQPWPKERKGEFC